MNLLVSSEQRYLLKTDGTVWTIGPANYAFFLRYLQTFEHVQVAARIQPVASIANGWTRADGEGVSFISIPYYVGLWQYLRRLRRIRQTLEEVARSAEAAILRVPSVLATHLTAVFDRHQHPYALEIIGDPWDVFAPGIIQHPLRPYLRSRLTAQLRQQCSRACATMYVTERVLQARYPSNSAGLSIGCSDVDLRDEAFASAPRSREAFRRTITIITVASLAQLYKAPDVLLDAVAVCVAAGVDLKLLIVGDGKYRPELQRRTSALGLEGRVSFRGQLPAGLPIYQELDQADLFVLASRTEGLPRAIIEAMARGLPCIGSLVGGIPELLPPDDLVPPGNIQSLASKIQEVVTDPDRLARMSARNLENARNYHEQRLQGRRFSFYRHVRQETDKWLLTSRISTNSCSSFKEGPCAG
jgi:glycosyltransferase involved in cell wall biosynthesis